MPTYNITLNRYLKQSANIQLTFDEGVAPLDNLPDYNDASIPWVAGESVPLSSDCTIVLSETTTTDDTAETSETTTESDPYTSTTTDTETTETATSDAPSESDATTKATTEAA